MHTFVALGCARHRNGDRDGAVAMLRHGLALADAGGARAVESHARAELSRLGVRPRRTAISGIGALTPSEHRVAELVAAGLTNARVAQTLVISPRTVEHHLTTIFAKLGIANRHELPNALDTNEDVSVGAQPFPDEAPARNPAHLNPSV